ncbi:type II restriction endonuclease [Parashewanella curva]|uniref:Type II restriction endonuclease n=1 Tax=Parashewanella curva TaxID=2338552 RepID=A0A3L8PRH3_9GAMM|nr:type II restriction endonuclease [Parashewanella curva]RLV58000.1 type II restriction endonuclease [Parashewanella curva]
MENLQYLAEIPECEQKGFDKFIQNTRKLYIPSPKDTVKEVLNNHQEMMIALKTEKNVSKVISDLRTEAYNSFLLHEAQMNAHILKNISNQFAVPGRKFDDLCEAFNHNPLDTKEKLSDFFGEYSGQIYPYIYRLSLSNTQSRRSRAGKVFEGIVYGLYDVLGYPYSSQATVGSKNFKSKKLGKIVDSLLPGLDAFDQRRDKVIIGTMKTTLRERWQEVIEEINRTMLPKIYLLTVDEDISVNKVEQMANHNVILVVYNSVKNNGELAKKRNVVSFEDYFFEEVPETLAYWNR